MEKSAVSRIKVSAKPRLLTALLLGVATATQSADLTALQTLLNQLAARAAASRTPPVLTTVSTPPALVTPTPSTSGATSSATSTKPTPPVSNPAPTPVPATTVKTAYVDRFEAVAQNASIPVEPYVHNSWGGHQPRIIEHADGTIRLVYLSTENNTVTWHLMRRAASGGWTQEASGVTTDDVGLVRHATSDTAALVAWPNSTPTVFTSPSFSASAIPGAWEKLPATSRHYGNIGVGSDGTLCLKVSQEFSVLPQTSVTNTEYECGTFAATSKAWNWQPFITHKIGLRYAYDYLFPNPDTSTTNTLLASSTSDVYRTASDVPNHDPSWGDYVFDGIRFYSTGLSSDASWLMSDLRASVNGAKTAALTGKTVIAPTMRLQDSFIDSKGRIFSGYYASDPYTSSVEGLYVAVANKSGSVLFQGKWDLPTYGYQRIFEDAKNRLWLLWSNQGTQATQVRLYPITETTVNGSTKFALGALTELGSAFNPYSIQGNLYITVPRGGNNKSLYVNAIYNTCWTNYLMAGGFQGSQCYNADGSGKQRVFYARIRLPD
jgi:hypothetical protein